MAKTLFRHLVLVGILSFFSKALFAAEQVTVFAASSLTNAMAEVGQAYRKQAKVNTRLSLASSSALARQVVQGAPADIYISANEKWMDYAVKQQAISRDNVTNLLHNRLVVIAPLSYKEDQLSFTRGLDLAKAIGDTRLALGDPSHVPVGMYAKQSLEYLGLWQQAKPLLARANNTRSALLLVEREEANLGIVYKTDALASDKVKIVAELPADSHSPISYPAGLLSERVDREAAKAYFSFLQSDEAKTIFKKHGFEVD